MAAASSGGHKAADGGVIVELPPIAVAESPHAKVGTLAPLPSRLYLDNCGAHRYQLSDIETLESRELPTGSWELVFAENGLAASLVCSASQDDDDLCVIEPKSKFMRRELFIVEGSGRRIVDAATGEWFDLDAHMSKHNAFNI